MKACIASILSGLEVCVNEEDDRTLCLVPFLLLHLIDLHMSIWRCCRVLGL